MCAADEAELKHMVATAVAFDDGPIAFRYPRGSAYGVEMPERGSVLEIGKGRIVREGSTIALLSLGSRLQDCLAAADELESRGLSTTVADARFAKPIDVDLIERLAREHEVLLVVEEGSTGGFGATVLHHLSSQGLFDQGLIIRCLTMPDIYMDQMTPERMVEQAGLDSAGIVNTVWSALKGEPSVAETA